jgi:hypothetical protein
VTARRQTVFDQSHYLKLIEARGETIRRMVNELKPAIELSPRPSLLPSMNLATRTTLGASYLYKRRLHLAACNAYADLPPDQYLKKSNLLP